MATILKDEDDVENVEDIEEEEEESEEPEQREPSAVHAPKIELKPSDFYFGATLGEGAFARVVHAKSKKNSNEFAIKIMEKSHIKRENKVIYRFNFIFYIYLSFLD